MIDTHRAPVEIDAEDVKALRAADTIVFSLHEKDGVIVSQARAIKRREIGSKWQGEDLTYDIEVGYSLICYAGSMSERVGRIGRCFSHQNNSKYAGVMHTLTHHTLRAGDKISIKWVADNNNDIVREHGLHHDEIFIIIERKGKKMEYQIDSRVSYDNSARDVQLYPETYA
jgi:hypothetical protein